MRLYVCIKDGGKYYQGCSPTGRVRETTDLNEAYFFTEQNVSEADDVLHLGYSLYSVEVSDPVLEKKSSISSLNKLNLN